MMRRSLVSVASASADYPLAATAAIFLLTVIFASLIPRLQIDTSAEGFMVARDPARVAYDRFTEQFGTDNVTVVMLTADDVFSSEVLGTVRRLTESLEQVNGVVRVESLATARVLRVDGDTLETRRLLGPDIPAAPADLLAVRQLALRQNVLVGNLVAANARATAILVYSDPDRADTEYNHRFVERVEALLAAEQRPGVTLYEVGRPLLKSTYSQYILRDLLRLIPIAAVVLLVILLLLFRTVDAVVVPMMTVGISIVWSFGMMALFGIPLNVLTAAIPPLLVTVGFTEDVHILSDFHSRLRSGLDKRAAVKQAMQRTAAPILVTTMTTVIGFASLGFSDVPMLMQFGYGAAVSLAGNYLVTMALLPPLAMALRRMPPAEADSIDRRWGEDRLQRFIEWLGWFNVRRRTMILVASGIVGAAASYGLSRIDVNTDFITYFPPEAPIRARAADAHRVMAGAEMFWIVVETNRPDGIKEPEVLRRIEKLQAHLAGTGQVDKTVSIVDYLKTINRDMRSGRSEDERVPASREEVAQYLLFVNSRDLSSLVNADSSTAAVLVRHSVTGSARLFELERQIDAYVASAFPRDVHVTYTGEAILTSNAADYMAVNEVTAFTFTFLAIAVVHSLLFMSVKIGLLSLVPSLIPIVVVYGLMPFVGVPLNTGTAIIATIAIGISVDSTVHHLMTYARALHEYPVPVLAMFATLREVTRPLATVSFALAAGFLVMLGSSFVPLRQFGLFAALTILLALITELIVTPALMLSIRVITVWDLVMLRIDPARLMASACFRDFSRWDVRKVVLLGALRRYGPGALVARRGDPGGGLFLIVTGRLRLGNDVDLEAGAVYGELPDGTSTWSGDVVAEEPSELLMLDFDTLERLRRRFPFTAAKLFRNIATVSSGGLRTPMPSGADSQERETATRGIRE